MMVADDDDASLNNGTPNDVAICNGFDLVSLPSASSPFCGDSSRPGTCRVDFDGDGTFTIFDLLVLRKWMQLGDPRADVNKDGHIDLFDHLETVEQGMRCQ